jgi:two-component system sensor histidine kinase PilS (NtrC family)
VAVGQPEGLRTSLGRLGWARLATGILVLAAGGWLRYASPAAIQFPFFVLAVAGTALNSLIFLVGSPWVVAGGRLAWLQVCLDTVLVTAIVATSGGPQSFFTFLYVLTVIEACVLLSRPGGVTVAGLSSLLYIGLVLAKTILPLFALMEPTDTTALEVLTVFTNAGVLMVLAIVAGSLAERYYTAQRDLATQHRHLSDVQAFRDLIFESVGAGLIAVDPRGRVTAFNRAAEAITGVPAAEALGDEWEAIFGDAIRLGEVWANIESGAGHSRRYEMHLTRRDGRQVPVGVAFWVLRSGEGAQVGLIGVCQDLSSIKQMEERMRQADRLAALGRLSANIAHEIRNPLASLSGAIEALARELPPEVTRGRLVEIVLRESERLNRLITELLEYARPAPLTMVEVDFARLLDDVLLLVEHRQLPASLKVVREYGDGLTTRADPQQMRQAIWNLCLNAVQAMPDGGQLRMGGRRVAAGGEHRIEIWVADSGHGIKAEDLPHVFEPFFSTKPEGTGLGLAAVYRIVQDHGGRIEVKSRPDGGTTMTVLLPALVSGEGRSPAATGRGRTASAGTAC